jgi:hypothetical protein
MLELAAAGRAMPKGSQAAARVRAHGRRAARDRRVTGSW